MRHVLCVKRFLQAPEARVINKNETQELEILIFFSADRLFRIGSFWKTYIETACRGAIFHDILEHCTEFVPLCCLTLVYCCSPNKSPVSQAR